MSDRTLSVVAVTVIVGFVLSVIYLVYLGMPKLDHGVVVAKRYEPASNTMMLLPISVSNGRTTSVIMVPYNIYDDEDWVITVTGTLDNGKTRTEDWYLCQSDYNKIQEGDSVDRRECGAVTEDPHTKERQ